MIVVFVVDTSPSMARPAIGETGMSRLDTAKMIVEDLSRQLRKRHAEHVRFLTQDANPSLQRSSLNLGQKGNLMGSGDTLLLLSTSRQYPDTAACAAGGRLLVGFGAATDAAGDPTGAMDGRGPQHAEMHLHERMESFQHELKRLKSAEWEPGKSRFPDDAGGAAGLNAALSAGLQLLSRYRLQNRLTENFGMGRIPNSATIMPNGTQASAALQPACLVLVTDGACLRQPPKLGGGPLQLQFGSAPLREFYKEPFRWDQRVFCLGVGGSEGVMSSQYLHPQLRALCEVTGGSHWMVRGTRDLQDVTAALLMRIRPPLPRELPLQDPLYLRLQQQPNMPTQETISTVPGSSFINGGPICSFKMLEMEEGSRKSIEHRAMLLYVGSRATSQSQPGESDPVLSPPLWCLPESYFPEKTLDTLPSRSAQPMLSYSKYPSNLGSKSFEPGQVIKMLHRLDQLVATNRKIVGQPTRLLHRDVYICEWLDEEGGKPVQISVSNKVEYFPVFCLNAGRPTLSDDSAQSLLNIGILHIPSVSSTLASQAGPSRLATLTLLPPEPHVLLPLLLKAAEIEHRVLRKAEAAIDKPASGVNESVLQKQISNKASFTLDEHWRTAFRAYLFRLPPYYQPAVKRALRSLLPPSISVLMRSDGIENIALQCFSQNCLQKIRNGEQIAKETIHRLERQEASLKHRSTTGDMSAAPQEQQLRYGQFDPRSSVDSYLAALRNMPPPWSVPGAEQQQAAEDEGREGNLDREVVRASPESALDLLGELPANCLMAYYESRRRWLFGGPSLATRGLHVEGVNNGGSNSQHCGGSASDTRECLLSMGGVGVSTLNRTSTSKMGDYRERLLFSRSPVVGYGSNDAAGVAATTAVDGSPVWSVDDDALPMTFFDPKTGDFTDSVQARVRSRLMVNFGNPYKEKRADSLIPENYLSQAPSMQQGSFGSVIGNPRTPPGSPPHDSFDSVEEGEAIFARKSPSRVSPKREEPDEAEPEREAKKPRIDHAGTADSRPPPPPKKTVSTKGPPLPPSHTSSAPPAPSKTPPNAKPPPPKGNTTRKGPAPPGKPPPKPSSNPPSPSKPQVKVSSQPDSATEQPALGQSQASETSVAEVELSDPSKKPKVDLPQGWMCVWSKSQKRWYFFDTRTNKSVWRWPPE